MDATASTVTAIVAAMGATARIGLYPETGPPIREADERIVIAAEAQSEMRRLEQQLRWAHAKAEALLGSDLVTQLPPEDRPTRVSSLLLLRSTRVMRELAMTFQETLMGGIRRAVSERARALRGRRSQWPGAALL